MIGQVVARGGYTLDQISKMDPVDISFIHYHQEMNEEKRFKTLFKALGILWDKNEINNNESRTIEDSNEIFIPLAMTIKPEILDLVNKSSNSNKKDGIVKTLGDGTAIDPELGPVKSMSDLSKEEFYRLIGNPIPSNMSESAKNEMKKKWIKDNK